MTWCCEFMAYGIGSPCKACETGGLERKRLAERVVDAFGNQTATVATPHPLGNRHERRRQQTENRAAMRAHRRSAR